MTIIDQLPASHLIDRVVDGPGGFSGVDGDTEWAAEVRRLVELRGATLLAHNYQLPAIQDIADHHSAAFGHEESGLRRAHTSSRP